MILIADGGSTSCDWRGVKELGGQVLFETKTIGLNPSYSSTSEMQAALQQSLSFMQLRTDVSQIYFFGSGANSSPTSEAIKKVLSGFFKNANMIHVQGDIQGAVFACTYNPAVVAILGTGSNICFFDGKEIKTPIPSLGYSIMDDGAGSAIGRDLLRDYFYNRMPKNLRTNFQSKFELDSDVVKKHLYKESFPGRYLASFASFAFENTSDQYFNKLVEKNIGLFFENNISYFEQELKKHPIHFVGSIAFFAKDIIQKKCDEFEYKLGSIVKSPIDQLVLRKQF